MLVSDKAEPTNESDVKLTLAAAEFLGRQLED
jgi:hypothetical protein